MRKAILIFVIMAVASTVIAQDLVNSRGLPVKNSPVVTFTTPPAEGKVGGETIESATVIPGIPYSDEGNTCGYINDYDVVCPYDGSFAPDVVYSFTPGSDMLISVDLCRSDYDTKTYIYDSDLNIIACNDDFYFESFCGIYVSKIERADLMGGETYFIVIDGFNGECGNYTLNVTEAEECFMVCPGDAVAEGEPPLDDGYIDAWNGGCYSDPPVFQSIDWINDEDGLPPYDGYAWLCGNIGYYINPSGEYSADVDWFTATALETGEMEFTVESEYAVHVYKVFPLDCGTAAIELQETANCGAPATLTFPVTAGEEVWLLVVGSTFVFPDTEYTYFATLRGHFWEPPVPNEEISWGGVKALYR